MVISASLCPSFCNTESVSLIALIWVPLVGAWKANDFHYENLQLKVFDWVRRSCYKAGRPFANSLELTVHSKMRTYSEESNRKDADWKFISELLNGKTSYIPLRAGDSNSCILSALTFSPSFHLINLKAWKSMIIIWMAYWLSLLDFLCSSCLFMSIGMGGSKCSHWIDSISTVPKNLFKRSQEIAHIILFAGALLRVTSDWISISLLTRVDKALINDCNQSIGQNMNLI